MKKLPYGLTDFKRIQLEDYYYIDKTRFISEIEEDDNFLFFIKTNKILGKFVVKCF